MFCVLCALSKFVRRHYYRTKYRLLGRLAHRPSYFNIFVGVHIGRALVETPDVKARVLPLYREFKQLPRKQQRVIIADLAREAGLDTRVRLALMLDKYLP
ncbi:hypothetical protein AURDEDRAFT_172356 [Auricularia subglabra TFB-10046 SS5]|nr:hypothetical protein AURDEDRAFT_172356 [Auricularia subglabra TFB-10046 SS5]